MTTRTRELTEADLPALQGFFEANPEYFVAVNGAGPRPDEARREFEDVPPADMPYSAMRLLGFFGDDDALIGMATVVADLIAPRVWHLGLFIVASALHGTGTAAALHADLERWMVEGGARWVRLGVVSGNAKAERFWEKCGYAQIRERGPLEMGTKSNLLRVMWKAHDDGSLDEYLALVPRDRVGAP